MYRKKESQVESVIGSAKGKHKTYHTATRTEKILSASERVERLKKVTFPERRKDAPGTLDGGIILE